MRTSLLSVALLCLPSPALQKSAKPDFKASIERAQKAFDAKGYGTASKELRNALAAVIAFRVDALALVLPPAPEGMTIKDTKRELSAGLLIVGGGSDVERRYADPAGARSITLKVQADSALVATILPMLTNPMFLQPGAELLEYGKHKAILRPNKNGKSIQLQIVIDQSHLLDIDARGLDREALLKVFDAAAVDKIAKELMN